MENELIKESK